MKRFLKATLRRRFKTPHGFHASGYTSIGRDTCGGLHLVKNRSGRPEPILTAQQWERLTGATTATPPLANDEEDPHAPLH